MRLADYLARQGISQKEFAKRSGLSRPTVSLLVRDLVWISRESARKICDATGGKVTAKDFMQREAAE